MTTTVRQWTGLEAKARRAALRMTIDDFAGYLGVGTRTVAKWESRGGSIEPKPHSQSILDTALATASSDVHARFVAEVNDSHSSRKTVLTSLSDRENPGDERGDSQLASASVL